MKKTPLVILAVVAAVLLLAWNGSDAEVLKEGDKTYIVDRTGEKWDITQAVSLGFRPERFQYGIGRHAFKTLDDSLLTGETDGVLPWSRIIGIADEKEAKAYSVNKLRRHEISNSLLGEVPVAVGY